MFCIKLAHDSLDTDDERTWRWWWIW